MVEQSGKHGPARDESLSREADLRAGDDQVLHRPELRGTPADDVEERFELARFLGRSAFPGDREDLARVAAGNGAPSEVIDLLRALPPQERFTNMQDLARTIGLGVEPRRR